MADPEHAPFQLAETRAERKIEAVMNQPALHDWEAWRDYMTAAGFAALEQYYRPAGLPREMQPWLASVWRKEVR